MVFLLVLVNFVCRLRLVFTMLNVKQALLFPYPDRLIYFLRRIPNDGTPAPLVHLFGKAHFYSFDLQSATDRWPLPYYYVFKYLTIYTVMMMFFGPSLASSFFKTT